MGSVLAVQTMKEREDRVFRFSVKKNAMDGIFRGRLQSLETAELSSERGNHIEPQTNLCAHETRLNN